MMIIIPLVVLVVVLVVRGTSIRGKSFPPSSVLSNHFAGFGV